MNREFKWLEERVRASSGPIVLCHNDPHGNNMRVGKLFDLSHDQIDILRYNRYPGFLMSQECYL